MFSRRGFASRVAKYPHMTHQTKPTESIASFVKRYGGIEAGSRLESEPASVLCGRVVGFPREASKKLYFFEVASRLEGSQVQVLAEQRYFKGYANEFQSLYRDVKQGDSVAIRGFPGKSKKGELSIVPFETTILAPCLRDIPSGRGDGKFRLQDKSTRYKNRHVDLLANGKESLEPFLLRAKVIKYIRDFYEERGFLEVETPILVGSAGGALAKPFITKADVTEGTEISLRIAPELALKQLLIGGVDKVFEIGKVFRNEGLSVIHNPEFTTCESYCAYADYEDMMSMTETFLHNLCLEITGSAAVQGIDFKPPFKRIYIREALEDGYGLNRGSFPDIGDSENADEVGRFLSKLLGEESEMKSSSVARNCKLVDRMIAERLETQCINPTFLCDHPLAMSPLAKSDPEGRGTAQRFELFVKGKELINAYTELNDPEEQMKRFQAQLANRDGIDTGEESMPVDAAYCEAMSYGLPPCAGWGIGIDRLVMLLSGKSSIRDVITFPLLP